MDINKNHDELKKALAIECVTKGKTPYYVSYVEQIMDSFEEGGRDDVRISQIVPGDSLAFGGKMKSMLCPHDTPNSFLHFYSIDIKDAMYEFSTGKFVLITSNSVLTNVDFSEELRLTTAEALANKNYNELSKMVRDFYDTISLKNAKEYLESNKTVLNLSDSQLKKIQWNPIALKKVSAGLIIERQYEGASNGINALKQEYEIDKKNELIVVSGILESIKGLKYNPPEIAQSQEQKELSNELELNRTRTMTESDKYRKDIIATLESRALCTNKAMITICDLSHTRFEDRSNGSFNQSINPAEIRVGMELGICGKLQDMKTKEELPGYADCFVEHVLVEIDDLPFDLLVIESHDTIYVGFGPDRELVKERVRYETEEQEVEEERDYDYHPIEPWKDEYPAHDKNDDLEIPPYPAPGRQEPLIIPEEPEEEPEREDGFEIYM